MTQSAHIKAIDWAITKGAYISVRDYSEDDYDLQMSNDRAAILAAIDATELPNVEIHMRDGTSIEYRYLLTFSVIDEGIPDETINDYTTPAGDASEWRLRAAADFERAVYGCSIYHTGLGS